jgi:hypothetical protein
MQRQLTQFNAYLITISVDKKKKILPTLCEYFAGPSVRAVEGVGLRPLAC